MAPARTDRPPPLAIPADELEFRVSRSSGPGGQHVNTSSTRVEVRWNVATTRVLSDPQRAAVQAKLANRVDQAGWIHVVASQSRSQAQNREAATRRLAELVTKALVVPKPRRPTRVSRAQKEKRLAAKRQRSRVKRERGTVRDDE